MKRRTRAKAVKRYIRNLEVKYELNPKAFVTLLLVQRRVCAICGRSREELGQDLVVDHDHATNEVRGLLCRSCNRTLGSLKDSTEWLEAALRYLREPPARLLRDLQR